MTSETRFKLALVLLLLALGLLIVRNAIADQIITLDVAPKFGFVSPTKPVTVRLLIRIERHELNRRLDIAWLWGSEQLPLDQYSPAVYTKFYDIWENEVFRACLQRVGRTICSVEVPVRVK